MDIEGLGIKQGQALIDAGILKDVADIYTLSDHRRGQLLAMERMAEKSVSNLLGAVEKSKSQTADQGAGRARDKSRRLGGGRGPRPTLRLYGEIRCG